MAIPDYQAFMQPMLILAKDQQEHSLNQVYDQLADHFQLTAAERAQLLPSGRQPTFKNRIGWARTYLSKAGLLETTRRGHFRITDLGLRELQEHGAEISSTYLRKFETFKQFQAVPRGQSDDQAVENLSISEGKRGDEIESPKETPEEAIDQAIAEMNNQLAEDLLGRLMLVSPSRFEHIVVELLVAMGYGGSIAEAGQVVGKSGDGGIDGIIKEDRLGLDLIYVQAKRWDSGISRPEIQKGINLRRDAETPMCCIN